MKLLYNIVFFACSVFCAFFIIEINHEIWQDIDKKIVEKTLNDLKIIKKRNSKGRVIYFPRSRNVYICGWINKKMAAETCKYLIILKNNSQDINLYVSSTGGDFGAVFQIIDAVNSMPYKVNTFAYGKCFVSGIYLVMSGTGSRTANANSLWGLMNHKYVFENNSRYDEICEDTVNKILQTTQIPAFDQKYFFFSANDALKYGIIDKIEGE